LLFVLAQVVGPGSRTQRSPCVCNNELGYVALKGDTENCQLPRMSLIISWNMFFFALGC